MKPSIRAAAVAAAFTLASLPAIAGPFGFQKGETKEQAVDQVGKNMIREVVPDGGGGSIVIFDTAPSPLRDFTTYSVVFAKDRGALKVVAATDPFPAEPTASDLYSKYEDLKAILSKNYGTPSRTNEPAPTDRIVRDREAPSKILSAYWAANPNASFNGDVTSVMLKAIATDDHTYFFVVSYELTGFDEYQKQEADEKAKAF